MSSTALAARLMAALAGAGLLPYGFAAALGVTVTDRAGKPVEDAAVYLEPLDMKAPPLKPRNVEIGQKDRRFSQMMTVIQVGQGIHFPNRDTVRHHVYSLSQARLFEIKLYSGVPANPVVFDKPGSVVLGCNIHDKMVSYIHVVDTPWFGLSDASGRARLEGLPDGRYRLRVWHHGLANIDVAAEQMVVLKGDAGVAAMRLDLRPGAL